jgi:hypothetical protein
MNENCLRMGYVKGDGRVTVRTGMSVTVFKAINLIVPFANKAGAT